MAIFSGVYGPSVEGRRVGISPGPPGIESAVVSQLRSRSNKYHSTSLVVKLPFRSPGGVLFRCNNAYFLAVVGLPFHITFYPSLLPHPLCPCF